MEGIQSDSVLYLNLKANILFNQQKFDQAAQLYQQIQHTPGVILTAFKLFDYQKGFKLLDKLLLSEEKAQFKTDKSAKILNLAGICFQLQGKLKQAE